MEAVQCWLLQTRRRGCEVRPHMARRSEQGERAQLCHPSSTRRRRSPLAVYAALTARLLQLRGLPRMQQVLWTAT